MPIALLMFALDAVLIIHAAKTGRVSPWAYIILLLPGVGAAAYILVELLPEWLGTYQGQQAKRKLISSVDPERNYRALLSNVAISDTIANRAALAEECVNIGKFDEGLALYRRCIADPIGDAPIYYFGKARAELGLNQPQVALATLEEMKRQFPDYNNNEAHLLYAKVLEACSRHADALAEYISVGHSYPGLEPRVRYVQLLAKEGRSAEAARVAEDIVKMAKLAPKHFQRAQGEWIAAAQKVVRG